MRIGVENPIINRITITYSFSIPILDDLLDMIARSYTFSKIDLLDGYHHFLIHESGEWKNAFKIKNELYIAEWLGIPINLSSAPSTYMNHHLDFAFS